MTLPELLALAEKATPGQWYARRIIKVSIDDADFIAACSPEVIAALVRCVMATDDEDSIAYIRARNELDRVMGEGA